MVLHGPKISGPTRSKDHKTVDWECLFIQQLASIPWLHSHLLFSYFRLIFVQGKSYKVLFKKQRRSRSAMLIKTQTASEVKVFQRYKIHSCFQITKNVVYCDKMDKLFEKTPSNL